MSLFIRCDFRDCKHIEKIKDNEKIKGELPEGWRNFANPDIDVDLCPEHVLKVWFEIKSKEPTR